MQAAAEVLDHRGGLDDLVDVPVVEPLGEHRRHRAAGPLEPAGNAAAARPLQRLVVAQDTGSAITGAGPGSAGGSGPASKASAPPRASTRRSLAGASSPAVACP